jgi:pimeloyl-ACP methyl ester carboxylesterase
MRWLFAFVLSVAASCLVIANTCDAQTPPQSRYIRNLGADRVIVFVHGFNSDSNSAWSSGFAYWPDLIASDHYFDGVDIFVYQYPTSISDSMTPSELAGYMRVVLRISKVADHRELIFIAHSMGGVVTREFLLQSPDIADKTKLIQFLFYSD